MSLHELFGLQGKTALVTGGTRGLGLRAAIALLEQGAEVVVTSRRAPVAAAAAEQLGEFGTAHSLVADLSTPDGAVELAARVAELFPSLHILVNNAGATWGAPFDSYPASAWEKVLRLDLAAPFQLVQQLLPQLTKASSPEDPARVINFGSIDGHSAGPFDNFAYGAAKAGLHHVTRLLARELGPRHVTVNCLAFGPIRTKLTAALLESSGEALARANPLRRLGEPDDIVGPLLMLAGRGGSYITGAVIPVDGGFAINRWYEGGP